MAPGRKATQDDQEEILSVLREASGPLSVGEISDILGRRGTKLAPYAIKYRLRDLIGTAVRAIGEGRGRRYVLAESAAFTALGGLSSVRERQVNEDAIAYIRRPRHERRYVGYDREFVAAYVPGQTWYLPESTREALHALGETASAELPAGTFARDILARLLIDLSWASSRLEGNTYTRLDTQNLIEFGQVAEGRDAAEAQMILNHKAAIELVVESASEGVSARFLRTLHASLAEGLLRDSSDEGRLRVRPVGITGTTYIPSEDPHLITECFERIATVAHAIPDPFERSFFLLVHLPYLQPFVDVNKRTARLAANIPLIAANLIPLTFVDVPEREYVEATLAIYELRDTEPMRRLYLWAYERSCEEYRVVRAALPAPDPIRLRHRRALGEVVAETVRARRAPERSALRRAAQVAGVPAHDVEAFANTALTVLLNLNDASAARYRLQPAEFEDWRARWRPPERSPRPRQGDT